MAGSMFNIHPLLFAQSWSEHEVLLDEKLLDLKEDLDDNLDNDLDDNLDDNLNDDRVYGQHHARG